MGPGLSDFFVLEHSSLLLTKRSFSYPMQPEISTFHESRTSFMFKFVNILHLDNVSLVIVCLCLHLNAVLLHHYRSPMVTTTTLRKKGQPNITD